MPPYCLFWWLGTAATLSAAPGCQAILMIRYADAKADTNFLHLNLQNCDFKSQSTSFSDGSVDSRIDEKRSKLRYLPRIADT